VKINKKAILKMKNITTKIFAYYFKIIFKKIIKNNNMLKQKLINKISMFLLLSFLWTSCSDDFNLTTDYKDQTVTYAFLEVYNSDRGGVDTNFVIVNKAFLGEKSVSEMAAVADSVNYTDYNKISVTLQRIASLDPNSEKIDEPIVLSYMKHYKEAGFFATDNNIVFYTTEDLMRYQAIAMDPSPNYDNPYYYRLSIKKPGQDEVYATTKMIRGIIEEIPLNLPSSQRKIQMVFAKKSATFNIKFQSNLDARLYDSKLRTYYYEKKDGKIYLKYIDYNPPMLVTKNKDATQPQKMEIKIAPSAFYANFKGLLSDTKGVSWRAIKTENHNVLTQTHTFYLTLGDQETYVYKQVSAPSNGIVQEKPIYTNITNGIGLFASKWNYKKAGFSFTNITIDSLAAGMYTKDLKFLDANGTNSINAKTIPYATVIVVK